VPTVICACGKRLRAGEEAAGRRVRCPVCGNVLLVPQASVPPADPDAITLAPEEPRAVSEPVPLAPTVPAQPEAPAAPRGPDLPATSEEEQPFNFWSGLAGAPAYPFQGIGWVILVTGIIFFSILEFAVQYAFIFAIVPAIFLGGFYWTYLFSIIPSSLMGRDTPPKWPELGRDEIVMPLLRLIAAVCVAFLPAVVAGAREAPVEVFWVLLAVGAFYLPMAIACIAIFDSIRALNPLLVFRAIARMFGHYLVTLVALALGIGAKLLAEAYVPEDLLIVSRLFSWFVSFYFAMVLMRMLGVLCRAHRDEF